MAIYVGELYYDDVLSFFLENIKIVIYAPSFWIIKKSWLPDEHIMFDESIDGSKYTYYIV